MDGGICLKGVKIAVTVGGLAVVGYIGYRWAMGKWEGLQAFKKRPITTLLGEYAFLSTPKTEKDYQVFTTETLPSLRDRYYDLAKKIEGRL